MSQEQNQANAEATQPETAQSVETEQQTEAGVETGEAVEATTDAEQTEQTADAEQAGDDSAAKIAELERALLIAENKVNEQKDSVVRAKAEVENIRRRSAQDVEKAHKFALEKFASDLLPVIDNLERAIQFADKENEQVKPVVEGVELTHQTFISTVEKFGLEMIDPQGQPFDPERHQAMSMVENPDVEPNTVTAVMQKGYVLNGRLLRPAMVMVAKAPTATVDTSV